MEVNISPTKLLRRFREFRDEGVKRAVQICRYYPQEQDNIDYKIQAGLTMYFSIHSTHSNSLNFQKQTTR